MNVFEGLGIMRYYNLFLIFLLKIGSGSYPINNDVVPGDNLIQILDPLIQLSTTSNEFVAEIYNDLQNNFNNVSYLRERPEMTSWMGGQKGQNDG